MSTKSKKRPTGKRPTKKHPKQSRPNPPAPTKNAAPEPAAKTEPEPRKHSVLVAKGNVLFGWVICLFFGFAHTALTTRASVYGDGEVALTLLLPMIVTVVLVPGARRHGWQRWIVLFLIPFIVVGAFAAITLAIAETWVLHRFWVVEYPDNLVVRWFKGRRTVAKTD